jgi:hypothetical protein
MTPSIVSIVMVNHMATHHDALCALCKQKEQTNALRMQAELYKCQQEKEVLEQILTPEQEEREVSCTCFSPMATKSFCMRLLSLLIFFCIFANLIGARV